MGSGIRGRHFKSWLYHCFAVTLGKLSGPPCACFLICQMGMLIPHLPAVKWNDLLRAWGTQRAQILLP